MIQYYQKGKGKSQTPERKNYGKEISKNALRPGKGKNA